MGKSHRWYCIITAVYVVKTEQEFNFESNRNPSRALFDPIYWMTPLCLFLFWTGRGAKTLSSTCFNQVETLQSTKPQQSQQRILCDAAWDRRIIPQLYVEGGLKWRNWASHRWKPHMTCQQLLFCPIANKNQLVKSQTASRHPSQRPQQKESDFSLIFFFFLWVQLIAYGAPCGN